VDGSSVERLPPSSSASESCSRRASTVDGLICFGYPLKGTSGAIRDEVLRQLTTRVIFIQGTRDALCPLGPLATVTSRLRVPHVLQVVEGGDHSLLVRRGDLARQGKTQADVDVEILAAVASFVSGDE
jgi:predicted alpha/beta-hydrolase family hydrolase